jgi:hypothetical protein
MERVKFGLGNRAGPQNGLKIRRKRVFTKFSSKMVKIWPGKAGTGLRRAPQDSEQHLQKFGGADGPCIKIYQKS